MPRQKRRTKFERERDILRMSDLYLRGRRQIDIAAELGLSKQLVSIDLKTLQGRWIASGIQNLDEAKGRELSKIDHLEATAWTEWERSQQEKVIEATRTKDRAVPGQKGGANQTLSDLEASRRTETHLGDARYLVTIQWCIERRCKLLGLDAPEKLPTGLGAHDAEVIALAAALTAGTTQDERTNLLRKHSGLPELESADDAA